MRLNEQVNEHLWDSLLCEILKENRRIELAELNNSDDIHAFSVEFEKNVQKIRRNFNIKAALRKIGNVMYKSVAVIAAILGITFVGLLTQPKVYAAVENVIRSIFVDHDRYSYRGEISDEPFDDNIRLSYVPEGYELRSIIYGSSMASLTYENKNEETIDFNYGFADSSSILIDNERHDYKTINCNGQTYYVYVAIEECDVSTVIWYNGDYVYSIDSQLPEVELVKIAENVKD